MTAEQLEGEFRDRGIARGGVLFLRNADAAALIQRAQDARLRVLEVDGFILGDRSTQPSMEHSIDLTSNPYAGDPWTAAHEFLKQQLGRDLYFEVVLE